MPLGTCGATFRFGLLSPNGLQRCSKCLSLECELIKQRRSFCDRIIGQYEAQYPRAPQPSGQPLMLTDILISEHKTGFLASLCRIYMRSYFDGGHYCTFRACFMMTAMLTGL